MKNYNQHTKGSVFRRRDRMEANNARQARENSPHGSKSASAGKAADRNESMRALKALGGAPLTLAYFRENRIFTEHAAAYHNCAPDLIEHKLNEAISFTQKRVGGRVENAAAVLHEDPLVGPWLDRVENGYLPDELMGKRVRRAMDHRRALGMMPEPGEDRIAQMIRQLDSTETEDD